MYSIDNIMSQKIRKIQSRLPNGITLNRISRNSIKISKPISSTKDESRDDSLNFESILEEVLTTHRVNPTTFPTEYTLTNYNKQPNIHTYISHVNPMSIDSAKYDDIIENASVQYDIPINLIKAIIRAESNFNPNAISHAGAMGLMQLMPSTAKSLGVQDPFNPMQNIDGGVRYIRQQLKRFGDNLSLALAAYNWGPNNILKNHITDLSQPAQFAKLPEETQNYIKKIYSYLKK